MSYQANSVRRNNERSAKGIAVGAAMLNDGNGVRRIADSGWNK